MQSSLSRRVLLVLGIAVLSGGFGLVAYANHAWGNYHWARTANPFTLKLGDNVTSAWDAHLALASSDWSQSVVLDTVVVVGGTNNTKGKDTPKNCLPTAGQVEVCNSKYGRNGWLGVASIWASGNHITQGTVKMNDTYFNTTKYNTPAWRNLVLCQEVGHTFGLDHQDEDFNNASLGTCMDYTSDPTPNQHPNLHDYEMLETIYAHLDVNTTVSQTVATRNGADVDLSDPAAWGKEIRRSEDGGASLFERDLGGGNKVFTHVFWAQPRGAR